MAQSGSYIPLTAGCYTSRSYISSAQRCVNLYMEAAPPEQGEPYQYVHNLTPGLTLLSQAPGGTVPIRGLYTASNGLLYGVANNLLYYIDPTWTWNIVGTMLPSAPSDAAQRFTPVSMVDNGQELLISDGSIDGWTANVVGHSGFARINSTNQVVTGTIASPIVTSNTTIIIDTISVTLGLTDTSLTGTVNAINAANIPNITASATTDNYLQIRDSTGTEIIIGPGTANAQLGIADGVYGIPDPGGWLGSNRVDFTDTYFIAAQPNSTMFYCSQSSSILFDALDFVNRSAKSDPIQCVIVTHRTILLMGTQTTEIWWNSGGGGSGALSGNTFPFTEFQNVIIQKGLGAIYSLAQQNNIVYFLGSDTTGGRMVYAVNNGNVERISTYAIEQEISQYSTTDDARGSCYQQQGHNFYVLSFPSGDATWVFDATTGQWHERVYIDSSGNEHRWRGDFVTQAYGTVVCADYENSNLYELDLNNYTDNGQPIKRVRSFPHQVDLVANRRVIFNQFIANMQVGSTLSSGTGSQTAIAANFNAPNGTLLTNYYGSIGGSFTELSGGSTTGIIYDDGFTGNTVGSVAYSSQGMPLSSDYTISYSVTPQNYASVANSTISIVARALSNSTTATLQGYQASVTGNGTSYTLSLSIQPSGTSVSLPMGTINNGVYNLTLNLQGAYIALSTERSGDGKWLNSLGQWQSTQAVALSLNDLTYTAPGEILIGGQWSN